MLPTCACLLNNIGVFFNSFRLAFGNECGIAIIDLIQRTVLLSMGTPDLYGTTSLIPLLT